MVGSWCMNWGWLIYWSWLVDWFVNWGWLMYWSWVIDWFVSRSWVIDRCWFVYWSCMIAWSWLMNWSWSSISLVRYICNVTGIVIGCVFDVLTSSIRKQDRIMSVYVASVGIFCGLKVGTSIIIAYAVCIMVWSWLVFRFMIRRCRLIRWSRGVICRSMVGWC